MFPHSEAMGRAERAFALFEPNPACLMGLRLFGLPGYARLDPVVSLATTLVRIFWGVILATPADGERMMVCPSS